MSKYHNQAKTSMGLTLTIQGFKTGDSWLDNKHNISFIKFMFFFSSTLISFSNTTISFFDFSFLNFRPIPLMTSLSLIKIPASVKKTPIKILACAIYTYPCFSYTYTFFFCWKIKSCCDHVFLCKFNHRPLFNYIYYETILVWGLVSIWLTNIKTCL